MLDIRAKYNALKREVRHFVQSHPTGVRVGVAVGLFVVGLVVGVVI